MDWDIRHLRCFVAVAHDGSFTRAAVRLRMSQPTLSLQIKELERRIGLSLLHRSTRRVELTTDGAMLLPDAERLVEESDRVRLQVEALRKHSQGILKLGAAFYTIDIPERIAILEQFMAEQPTAHLDVQTKWQAELMDSVAARRLDMALVIGRAVAEEESPRGRRGELVFPAELKRITLRSERIELLVPRELAIAAQAVIPPEALKGMRVALMGHYHGEAIVGPLRDLLSSAGAHPFTPPEGNAVAVERYGRQFRIPAMTLGWFGQDPRLADMVRRPIAGLELATELSLISNSDFEKPMVRRFWKFAETWSGQNAPPNLGEVADDGRMAALG